MNKLQVRYKDHVIVVEVDHSDEPTHRWLTSWIDGFTFTRKKVLCSDEESQDVIYSESARITHLLANNLIVRHTFTDKYGDLYYWKRVTTQKGNSNDHRTT